MKTYRLCGATQRHFLPPRLVPFAARTKPGLGLVDSAGPSLLLAKTRLRKVRVWVEWTTVSMETDGLEIVGGRSAKGELKRIVHHRRTTKGTGPETRSTLEERTGIILLFDTFAVGQMKSMKTQKKKRKIVTNVLLVSRLLVWNRLME